LALVIWYSNTWNTQVTEFYAARIEARAHTMINVSN